jgi:hypothetical protein
MKSGRSAMARCNVSSRNPEPSMPVADKMRISFTRYSFPVDRADTA